MDRLAVRSTAEQGAVSVDHSDQLPHGLLIAGDNNSPAFDNGVRSMRDKLAAQGVRDMAKDFETLAAPGAAKPV